MIYRLKQTPWKEQDFGPKRPKSVCVSRYGAYGDMMQMSSILPGLKDQGYHVTVNTVPRGYEIMKHDPHIDDFFLQEDDQVPNHELGFFWTKLSECFDKFIMLAESVEASLLAIPGRRESAWHPDFRRLVMGTVDYLEATHAIAEVPLPPRVSFYPTPKETKWADKYRARLGKDTFVILWALSGSALYKVWPHMDVALARLMIMYPNVTVITCGGEADQVLEFGWEKEKRVIRKAGRWSIRESLTFAEKADLIIGPETGLLNALCMKPVPKILLLSHSSKDNIGKNWVNAKVIEPDRDKAPCYPCHTLHFGFQTCTRDETTGASLCAASIPPETVMDAIEEALCQHI